MRITPFPKPLKKFIQGAIGFSCVPLIGCSLPSTTSPKATHNNIHQSLAEKSKQCKLPSDLMPASFDGHAMATVKTLSNEAQFAFLAKHTHRNHEPGKPVRLTSGDGKEYTFQKIFSVPNTDLSFAYNPKDGQRILKALQEENQQQKAIEAPLMVAKMHTLARSSTDNAGTSATKYVSTVNGLTYFQLALDVTNSTNKILPQKQVLFIELPQEQHKNEALRFQEGFSGSPIIECNGSEAPQNFIISRYFTNPTRIAFRDESDPKLKNDERISLVTRLLSEKGFSNAEIESMTQYDLTKALLATPVEYSPLIEHLKGSTPKGPIQWGEPPAKQQKGEKREKLPIEFK